MQCCPKSIKAKLLRIGFYTMLSGASQTTLHRVFSCAMLPQDYQDNIKQDFFLCNVVWSHSQYFIGFWPVQYYLKSIKTTLDRFFSSTMSLEPLRQYCIEFSAVKCCCNSIKPTLHRIFSDAILSGAFQATFHRVVTCLMLSQEYQG